MSASRFPAYTNMAIARARTGKLDEALEAFARCVALQPESARAQNNYGAALTEAGRMAEAVEHCRKAVELDPEYADARNSLAAALGRLERVDEAIPHLEKAVQIKPDDFDYRYNLGRFLAAAGRFQEAAPHFEKAASLSQGREPLSLEMLAAMYSEMGRYREAVEAVRRALDIAVSQNNSELAEKLRTRLAFYQSRLQ